jgi:hypothetical protein
MYSSQNKRRLAAYRNVLADHLASGKVAAFFVAIVDGGGNLDESHLAGPQIGGPLERLNEWRPASWRIPLGENEFRRDAMALALGDQAIDEGLRAAKKVAAVIVIAGGHHNRKVWATATR